MALPEPSSDTDPAAPNAAVAQDHQSALAHEEQQAALDVWDRLRPRLTRPTVVIVMGVSGSGKTTLAAMLAAVMHWRFAEGDDLHPPENVAKMHAGVPLTDADRAPWLARIAAVIDQWRASGVSGVVTCSALKRAYRDVLIGERTDVELIYLRGERGTLAERMAKRTGHFMPASLLDSQIETLEPPAEDEGAIVLDTGGTPHALVVAAVEALAAREAARAA